MALAALLTLVNDTVEVACGFISTIAQHPLKISRQSAADVYY
jgi:hypothetical protein